MQQPKPAENQGQPAAQPREPRQMANKDKFALRAFNRLAHDREISGPLAASTLLQLPEFYTPKGFTLKKISTDLIRGKFPALVFPGVYSVNRTLHRIGKSIKRPTTLFENYQWRGQELEGFSLFDYTKLVSVVKKKTDSDIMFSSSHLYSDGMFQRPFKLESLCRVLVALIGSFSTNKAAEDAVHGAHIDTDARQNDMGLILLALFIPWQLLPAKFKEYGATPESFETYCWQIWVDLSVSIEPYAQFHADNILQMRKSQLECQLDREQRRAAQTAAAETAHMEEITATVDDQNCGVKHQWEDGSHPDWLNIVSQAAHMARLQWQNTDVVNALKFTVVSHLQHSLQFYDSGQAFMESIGTASHANNTARRLNLGRQPKNITADVSKATVDSWKAMQKAARNHCEQDYNNEDSNGADVSQHALNSAHLSTFEPDISFGGSTETQINLDPPTPTSIGDCRILTNLIHETLPLNFLQRLIVERDLLLTK